MPLECYNTLGLNLSIASKNGKETKDVELLYNCFLEVLSISSHTCLHPTLGANEITVD
jgi:hypothetical protein